MAFCNTVIALLTVNRAFTAGKAGTPARKSTASGGLLESTKLGVRAPCYPICYLINKLAFSSSDEANDKSFLSSVCQELIPKMVFCLGFQIHMLLTIRTSKIKVSQSLL